MKNFLKLFLIFLSFFISSGVNNYCTAYPTVVHAQVIYAQDDEIKLIADKSENFIASSNNQNKEVTSFNDKKNNFNTGFTGKSFTTNKLLLYYFFNQYNQLFISSSHKISSYLKNEICTRAP